MQFSSTCFIRFDGSSSFILTPSIEEEMKEEANKFEATLALGPAVVRG